MIIKVTVDNKEYHYFHCKYVEDEMSMRAFDLAISRSGRTENLASLTHKMVGYLKGSFNTARSFTFGGTTMVRVEVE